MRVLGPKEYLENLKYQRVNEEVFQNDISWGDSLVGRMFASVGRKVSDTYNNKKIGDLLKKLEDTINVEALKTVEKNVPEIKESSDKAKQKPIIDRLIGYLEKGDIEGVKRLSENVEFDNVLNKLNDDDRKFIESLLDDKVDSESDTSIGNIETSLKDFKTIIDTVVVESYYDFSEYFSINESINNYDQFKVLIKREKDLMKRNLKSIFIEIKKFYKNPKYTIIDSANFLTKGDKSKFVDFKKVSEISKEISDFLKLVKDGRININDQNIKDKIVKLKLDESILIKEEFQWDSNRASGVISNLKKIDTKVDVASLSENDEKIENIKQFPIDSLKIVQIFKDASRLFIKQRIPSSRSDGRISNSRAQDWEKVDRNGGVEGVDPKNPGSGPFRRISLFDKWNDGVLDIINKYDNIISNAVIKKKDGSIAKDKEGENVSPLKKFMIDSLEKPELQIGGSAQSTYLRSHLGMDEKTASSFSEDGKKSSGNKSDNETKLDSKWEWVDSEISKTEHKGLYRFSIRSNIELEKGDLKIKFPQSDSIYLYISGNNGKNNKNNYPYWGIISDRDDWIKIDGYSISNKNPDTNIYYCEINFDKKGISLTNVTDIYSRGRFEIQEKVKDFKFEINKIIKFKRYLKDKKTFNIDNDFTKGCKKELQK
jgi:hypothetical protein